VNENYVGDCGGSIAQARLLQSSNQLSTIWICRGSFRLRGLNHEKTRAICRNVISGDACLTSFVSTLEEQLRRPNDEGRLSVTFTAIIFSVLLVGIYLEHTYAKRLKNAECINLSYSREIYFSTQRTQND
jgi:hypothetical protein